jgi:hypothetical protein
MTAALPLPFMELSVSVVDTLDLLRSSVEEEVRWTLDECC